MVISKNSQLGLMMDDKNLQVEFLEIMISDIKDRISIVEKIEKVYEKNDEIIVLPEMEGENLKLQLDKKKVNEKITLRIADNMAGNLVNNKDTTLYLICNGVESCAEMVRVGDNFSSKPLRKIKNGSHTYLLGKDEVIRFLCRDGAIKGIYWKRSKNIAFEFGFDTIDEGYYFHENYKNEFNKIAKLITFIVFGDIEVVELEKGRNNGKSKSNGKITNTSDYKVFVVDSSWNKLIIRTEGFAVRGHFRLQPCGVGMLDRKLIWIYAFEKHGYKRNPKSVTIN